MLSLKEAYILIILFAIMTCGFILISTTLPQKSPNTVYKILTYNSTRGHIKDEMNIGHPLNSGPANIVSSQNQKDKSEAYIKKISKLTHNRRNSRRKKEVREIHPLKVLKFEKEIPPPSFNPNPGGVFQDLVCQFDSTVDDVCEGNSTFILAIVPSSADNFSQRQMIRETWASKELFLYTRLSTVFLLGATNDSNLQKQVEEEGLKHQDIIQMNYLDSYRNLTYKTMTALKWISERCPDIPWILKIDDDVLMNPFNLRIFLEEELTKNPSPSVIYGRLRSRSKPFRNGKWKVTEKEYSNKLYPRFVLGSAYIIGRNAVEKLITAASSTPFLYLEDVYFTGIVSQKANVELKNIERTKFSKRASVTLSSGATIFLVGSTLKLRNWTWQKILSHKPKLIS